MWPLALGYLKKKRIKRKFVFHVPTVSMFWTSMVIFLFPNKDPILTNYTSNHKTKSDHSFFDIAAHWFLLQKTNNKQEYNALFYLIITRACCMEKSVTINWEWKSEKTDCKTLPNKEKIKGKCKGDNGSLVVEHSPDLCG